jgi:hypothetical protein
MSLKQLLQRPDIRKMHRWIFGDPRRPSSKLFGLQFLSVTGTEDTASSSWDGHAVLVSSAESVRTGSCLTSIY